MPPQHGRFIHHLHAVRFPGGKLRCTPKGGGAKRLKMARPKGFRHLPETIEKIRKSNVGLKRNPATRLKISLAKKGVSLRNRGSFKPGSEPWNKNMCGIHLSPATEFRGGQKPPNWKGGRIIQKGYINVWKPDHPNASLVGYILEHRLVMESKIGRLLKPNEIVHHIDGNRLNNDPTNLCLTTRGKHQMGYGRGFKEGYEKGFAAAFFLFFLKNNLEGRKKR